MLSVAQQKQVYALFNSTLTLVVKCEQFQSYFQQLSEVNRSDYPLLVINAMLYLFNGRNAISPLQLCWVRG
jgi:hypothetical protein